MTIKTMKKYILAKVETTEGTDAVPVVGDAILTSGLQIQPYEGNTVQRNVDRPTFGADETINTGAYVMATFAVELAGSGTAGDAPAFGTLLRGCAFAETITASTSAAYDPVSESIESLTLYYDQDGQRHKILNCKGTFSLDLAASGYPMMNFTFTGIYADPVAATLLEPDNSNFQTPLPVNKANTGTFTIDSYAAIMQSLSLDIGNTVEYRNLVNHESVAIGDRNVSGSAVVEAPALATKNFFEMVRSDNGVSLYALQLIHGTTAGNKVQIDCPKIQVTGLAFEDIGTEQGYNLSLASIPDDGDDEIKLTFF